MGRTVVSIFAAVGVGCAAWTALTWLRVAHERRTGTVHRRRVKLDIGKDGVLIRDSAGSAVELNALQAYNVAHAIVQEYDERWKP